MLRIIRAGAFATALLGMGVASRPCLAQGATTPTQASSASSASQQQVIVREPNRPERRCLVMNSQTLPDGSIIYQVKALDDGEIMLIKDESAKKAKTPAESKTSTTKSEPPRAEMMPEPELPKAKPVLPPAEQTSMKPEQEPELPKAMPVRPPAEQTSMKPERKADDIPTPAIISPHDVAKRPEMILPGVRGRDELPQPPSLLPKPPVQEPFQTVTITKAPMGPKPSCDTKPVCETKPACVDKPARSGFFSSLFRKSEPCPSEACCEPGAKKK